MDVFGRAHCAVHRAASLPFEISSPQLDSTQTQLRLNSAQLVFSIVSMNYTILT